MDARHETFQQEILNQVISTINQYIKNNTDDLLLDNILQDQIKEISKHIYLYSKIAVDVEGILSKHNLLSIDVVLFPLILDVNDEVFINSDFEQLLTTINAIIQQEKSPIQPDSNIDLLQQMKRIISQCIQE